MKYLLGTETGGIMENPQLEVTGPFQIIEADSKSDAIKKYNAVNNCSYYYGTIIGHCYKGKWNLTNDLVNMSKFMYMVSILDYDSAKAYCDRTKASCESNPPTLRGTFKLMSLSSVEELFEKQESISNIKSLVIKEIESLIGKGVVKCYRVTKSGGDLHPVKVGELKEDDIFIIRKEEGGVEFTGPYGQYFIVEMNV